MKKIFAILAVFAALIFAVSCGGSSKTGDTSDTGETVTDEDGDTENEEETDFDIVEAAPDGEDCPTIDGNMWSSRSSETMDRWDAVDYCEELNECGYSDWRLPDINELRMLIKNCPETQTGGACPVKDPNSLDIYYGGKCSCEEKENNGGYYSKLGDDDSVVLRSSSIFDHVDGCVVTTLGWVVDFSSGSVDNDEYSYYYCHVRCVR